MTHALDSIGIWFADYYLLSAILLLLAAIAMRLVRQPVHRLAIIKSTLFSLALLAGLCALPSWSIIHLLTALSVDSTALPIESPSEQANLKQQVLLTDGEPGAMQPGELQQFQSSSVQQTVATRTLSWPATLAAAQIAGASCVIAWLAVGMIAAMRLRASATAAPPELQSLFSTLLASRRDATTWPRLSETRKTELLTSPHIEVPVAIGIIRPAIILPLPFREGPGEGSSSMLEPNSTLPTPHSPLLSVLAHEFAHITNHDLHWLAASRALMILLWSQPLFWFARRRMRLDQESLADAAAADITSREQYAEQLITWARNLGGRHTLRVAAAVGLWESPSQLRRRIEVLIDERLTVIRQCPRPWRIAAAALATFAAVALSVVTIQPLGSAIADEVPGQNSESAEAAPAASETLQPTYLSEGSPKSSQTNSMELTCMDQDGKPLENVEVKIYRVKPMSAEPPRLMVASLTGSNGKKLFTDLISLDAYPWVAEYPNRVPPATSVSSDRALIMAVAKSPGRASTWTGYSELTVLKSHVSAELRMPPAATIRGRVADKSGKPISGAVVSRSSIPLNDIQTARTHADGNYVIDDAAAFTYSAEEKKRYEQQKNTWTAGPVTAGPPSLIARHDKFAEKWQTFEKVPGTVDFVLEDAGGIRGRVLSSAQQSQPKFPVTVRIDRDQDADAATQSDSPLRMIARTDESGNFEVNSLRPGTYSIYCDAPGWYCDGVNAARAGIKVQANETTPDVYLFMQQGTAVTAQLVDATTDKPVTFDNPIDTEAILVPKPGTNGITKAIQIRIDRSGKFIVALPPGELALSAFAGPWEAIASRDSMFTVSATEPSTISLRARKKDSETTERQINNSLKANPSPNDQGAVKSNGLRNGGKVQLVQSTTSVDEKTDTKRPPALLSYSDNKPDGKKSYGGSGFMIEFEMPEGVSKIKGIRIHSSRYGVAQAPNEDFEITFLSDKRDEVLHTESAPYKLFKRGKENWVRIPFKEEVELPKKFWVALDFNADQNKGVYVSYDTSTKGEHSRVGLAGDDKDPKNTDFAGDWMIQVLLAAPAK